MSEGWAKVKEIVYRALELPPDGRDEFLARACEGDEALLDEARSLLAASDEAASQGTAMFPAPIFDGARDVTAVDGASGPAQQKAAPAVRARRRMCVRCRTSFDAKQQYCSVDGEPLVEDPENLVGETLDGLYRIEALLGAGGMGAVYRARHVVLDDRVAIKTLLAERGASRDLLRRFRREGQAARRFRHPNAVAVYDLRTSSDGVTYMVQEYVDGRTLREELHQRHRLTLAETLDVVEPVASLLDAAHAHGVVHRDLKPENVMLGKDEAGRQVVKVLDLGIAKLREIADSTHAVETTLTHEGAILGTPVYMSPEQWGELSRDGGTEIDGRADLYSLAVMIYEMVSGQRPFEGQTLQELRRGHVSREPAPLDMLVPEAPAPFARAVRRALEKDRADRQATAGEFARELRAALEGTDSEPHGKAEPSASASQDTVIQAVAPSPPGEPDAGGDGVATPRAHPSKMSRPAAAELDRRARARSRRAWSLGTAALVVAGIVAAATYRVAERSQPQVVAATKRVPVLRYYLELNGGDRSTGLDPLPAQRSFRLHFAPDRSGYLYIVEATGAGLKTFLTAIPDPRSAVQTNALEAGRDFEFPTGATTSLALDDDRTVTTFVVVFSPSPLETPSALAEPAGRALSDEEAHQFDDLRTSGTLRTPDVELTRDGQAVTVTAPEARLATEPVVFELPLRSALVGSQDRR